MESNWELVTNFSIGMLAIVNPIEKIPLCVAASANEKKKTEWCQSARTFDPPGDNIGVEC